MPRQRLSRARNEINALDLQKQGNVVRLEKLAAEKIQLEEERVRLQARLQEFAAHVEAQKLRAQTHRGTVEERQERLRQVQHDIVQAAQELDARLQEQAEKRTRLDMLEQLQAGHEGFSAGTLAALKQSEAVLGSLADKIRAALKKLFEDEPGDAFLEMHPLGEQDARLFTAWTGGSAYHFRVLAFVNGQVKQVLEESKGIDYEDDDDDDDEGVLSCALNACS